MNANSLPLSIELPRDSTCARIARSAILEVLDNDPRADALELITSELVTNAFVHGSGDIHLTVSSVGERLRVEVSNETDQVEFDFTPKQQELDAERGRGMALVQSFSSGFGHTLRDSRLTIWAEVN